MVLWLRVHAVELNMRLGRFFCKLLQTVYDVYGQILYSDTPIGRLEEFEASPKIFMPECAWGWWTSDLARSYDISAAKMSASAELRDIMVRDKYEVVCRRPNSFGTDG